jgi:hypothetical protein
MKRLILVVLAAVAVGATALPATAGARANHGRAYSAAATDAYLARRAVRAHRLSTPR